MSKFWTKQKISNHNLFPNVERYVVVENVNLQAKYGQVVIEAYKEFYDGEGNNISKEFDTTIKEWYINNQDVTTMRDGGGNPLVNPEFIEGESPEEERYLKAPSFDYFYDIIVNSGNSLLGLLQAHIAFNDELGFFNK